MHAPTRNQCGCFKGAKTRVNCRSAQTTLDVVYDKSTSRSFGISLIVVDDDSTIPVEVIQDECAYLEMVKSKTGDIDFVYHAFQVRCSPFTTLSEICAAFIAKLDHDINSQESRKLASGEGKGKTRITMLSVHVAGEEATFKVDNQLKSLHMRNGDTVQILCMQLPQQKQKRSLRRWRHNY